jgi:amidase
MMANKPIRRDSVLPIAAASLLAPQAQTSPHEASGPSNEFHYCGAKELAAALEQKGVSALELVEHAIKRIESLDPQINALIVRDFERARAAAIAADKALARSDRKPLLSIPMTVKQQYHVAGLPTTWPDTQPSRVEMMALLETLNAMLLSRPSATVTLEDWCRDRRLAVEPAHHRASRAGRRQAADGGATRGAGDRA